MNPLGMLQNNIEYRTIFDTYWGSMSVIWLNSWLNEFMEGWINTERIDEMQGGHEVEGWFWHHKPDLLWKCINIPQLTAYGALRVSRIALNITVSCRPGQPMYGPTEHLWIGKSRVPVTRQCSGLSILYIFMDSNVTGTTTTLSPPHR